MKTAAEIFLIAGGRESRARGGDPLLAGIFARIGLVRPRVAYVGAASDDSRDFFAWASALLKKAGAGAVRLAALASPRADLRASREILQTADLVFISGGDVEAGMRVLDRAGFGPLLERLHRAGKPFIGLSAGSIMLGRNWVRWADSGDDDTAEVFPCMGLVPFLCDTHAEKEDWKELKQLLKLTRATVGYGLPAGSALRVSAAGSLVALGRPVQRFTWRNGVAERIADLPVA